MNRLNQYIYLAEQLDSQLSGAIAELQGERPDEGRCPEQGRVVLRPPEAPRPAHPIGGLDPGLLGR